MTEPEREPVTTGLPQLHAFSQRAGQTLPVNSGKLEVFKSSGRWPRARRPCAGSRAVAVLQS